MKFYVVLVLVFLASNVRGQECKHILLGEIVDFHDNSPLQHAMVSITGLEITTMSDTSGKFRLEGFCNGPIELEVSHPECKSQFVTITIDGDTY